MNLSKTPLRRASALVASSLLGLAGVAVFASPAHAHHPDIKGETKCAADGGWTVDWKVANDYQMPAKITQVKLNDQPTTVGDIKVGEMVDADRSEWVTGSTTHTAQESKAVLWVEMLWDKDYEDDVVNHTKREVWAPGNCPQPTTPPVTTPPVTTPPVTTPPVTTPPVTTPPVTTPPVTTPPVTTPPVTTPPVTLSPTPTPSVSIPAVPGEPTPIVEFTCDSLTFGFDNPADSVELKLHFKTSKGEERDLVIAPGETKTEKFSATEGFKVDVTLTVTVDGETESGTFPVAYTKPADCDGEGGGLPVTGAAAGGIAGGAAALLAAGAVLFVMARRRKLKFTA